MEPGFHPRKQGDIGEAHAIAWLTEVGAEVCVPLFHSRDYDAVAQFRDRLLRIQVKTSGARDGDRSCVYIATNGGNQSWTGAVRYFDRSRCDFLFIRLTDGRRWFVPSTAVDGKTSITVGGPKYSEYEIMTSGEMPVAAGRALDSPSLFRGSADVGESGGSVKSVPSAEWVRIPPPPLPSSESGRVEPVTKRSTGRSTMSSGHQMTIPIGPFRAAGLAPGDRFEIAAVGPGELHVTRVHPAEPFDGRAQPELSPPAGSAPAEAA